MKRDLFFRRKPILWPTLLGWLLLCAVFAGILGLWCFAGEGFFSVNEPAPGADVLVVEGWIGYQGVLAAKQEFLAHGYQFLVTTGAQPDQKWDENPPTYAVVAGDMLRRSGLNDDRLIVASPGEFLEQRTFHSAEAVAQALAARGIHPRAINVFTLGLHARRSRLIFARALPNLEVGVISWKPPEYAGRPWWRSSERAEDMLKETGGYAFERLLHSGR